MECQHCMKLYKNRYSFKQHVKEYSSEITESFTCTEWEKSFTTSSKLKRHIETHTVKEFNCEKCGKSFPKLFNLKRHMDTHNGTNKEPCTVCNKEIFLKYSFSVPLHIWFCSTKSWSQISAAHCFETAGYSVMRERIIRESRVYTYHLNILGEQRSASPRISHYYFFQ